MRGPNEIIVVGEVRISGTGSGITHTGDLIISEEGICKALCAREYKDPRRVLIRRRKNDAE